ncbi:MAG: hypothetical protein WAV00_15010 [Nocardioides sp.]
MNPPARRPGVDEFDADQVEYLLAQLDARLRDGGVAAAVFVVGGAAIAATGIRVGRLTADVDALTRDQAVIEEARVLAVQEGLSASWLNANAAMWMPPLPDKVLDPPAQPGLRITYAEDGFLLATKLIAQRAKDADDIIALASRLGLTDATPAQLEDHIRRYYTDPAALEFILDGHDADQEVALLAQDASRMLNRIHRGQGATPESKTPAPEGIAGPGSAIPAPRAPRATREPEMPQPGAIRREPPGPGLDL